MLHPVTAHAETYSGETKKIEITGQYAATLSLVELALGSVLHSFRVPFAGTFLSLNQGFLLCRAALAGRDLPNPKMIPYGISNVAAVLKSLAPAGKKLGPMVSLSVQGFLFSVGPWIFGAGTVGLSVGMALLSVWTFLQPVLTYYLFFGSQIFAAFEYLLEKTLPYVGLELNQLAWILAGVVALKMGAAIGLARLAIRSQHQRTYQERLVEIALEKGARPAEAAPGRSAFYLAFRDLFQPLFLVSLATTAGFLYFSEQGRIGWMLLRPIAVGFVFFYFSRTLTLDRWLARLETGRFRGFALACATALQRVRGALGSSPRR